MGAKRKMSAANLEKKVNEYFDSIRAERPLLRKVPDTKEGENGALYPKTDAYGHEMYRYEPVKTVDGKQAVEVIWTEPPSIIGLSIFLGVDRTTLFRWKNLKENKQDISKEEEKLCNIVSRAWGRIEAYLTKQTENPKAARGATANLEANFGWKRRKELGFDDRTTAVVVANAATTMEEKLKELEKLGISLPWMDALKEEKEMSDDDE